MLILAQDFEKFVFKFAVNIKLQISENKVLQKF